MNLKRMLFIEDDRVARKEASQVLRRRGWKVEHARDGEEALEKLRKKGNSFDVVILDLKMPNMRGEKVLEQIQDEKIGVPPIIVFSAWLTPELESKCRYLGAAHAISKPFNPAHLSEVAELFSTGAQIGNTGIEFDDNLINYMVERREKSLKGFLNDKINFSSMSIQYKEPTLIIGRRWNSWYPSVFDVPGGSYIIVGPKPLSNNDYNTDQKSPCAIIDPGFRFQEIVRKLNVSITQIDSFVITHNHPDHIGGVFELMTARHVFRNKTRAFCSSSVCDMLGNCSGFNLEVKQLDDKYSDLIKSYETDEKWIRIRIKGFDTSHEEIGRENSSKGLCLSIDRGTSPNDLEASSELIILGDTAYERSEHRDKYIPYLTDNNVKIVVLHIGSSQFKQQTGKHLYLTGLKNILHDMDSQLTVNKYKGQLVVLVSEWGLEHATERQIKKICGKTLVGFDKYSPILETIKTLNKGLSKIKLIPADIGLRIGIETCKIYLDNDDGLPLEDIMIKL